MEKTETSDAQNNPVAEQKPIDKDVRAPKPIKRQKPGQRDLDYGDGTEAQYRYWPTWATGPETTKFNILLGVTIIRDGPIEVVALPAAE